MSKKKYFGVLLDCSRNGVLKLDQLKKMIDYLSLFGYNSLQLYTEDTFELPGEPFFGYMRAKYTQAELREIDDYCIEKEIELIPCIQTLAHLKTIFHFDRFRSINDYDDILLADDQKTYELLDKIFETLSKSFKSKKINIGMDEAFMLGLGKHLRIHGYEDQKVIFLRHLNKVVSIAKKYGFEPLMWSDMLFRLTQDGQYEDISNQFNINQEINTLKQDDCGLIYWEYYSINNDHYQKMIKSHQVLTDNLWFATSAHTCQGFAPANSFALKRLQFGISSAKMMNVENYLVTLWGDDGKECSYFSALPTLFYAKKVYDGEENLTIIKKQFFDLTGETFDDMINLDLPNQILDNVDNISNPSKYVLYGDLFNNFLDLNLKDGAEKDFEKNMHQLMKYGKKSPNFSYLFTCEAKLCKVLSIKYKLGSKIKKAYQNKNYKVLEEYVNQISKLMVSVKQFYKDFAYLWYHENKPQGMDVQDIRFGALLMRLKSCQSRLIDYLNHKTDSIPEFDEVNYDVFYTHPLKSEKKWLFYNSWEKTVTTNVL